MKFTPNLLVKTDFDIWGLYACHERGAVRNEASAMHRKPVTEVLEMGDNGLEVPGLHRHPRNGGKPLSANPELDFVLLHNRSADVRILIFAGGINAKNVHISSIAKGCCYIYSPSH